ncbi:hypothetical protein CNMCM5878_003163 [Aspergillus fumigatiaffinis]|nr:hypothetical protein CNMCM5878_003163 [Aspergillus fumigatiaffinis]
MGARCGGTARTRASHPGRPSPPKRHRIKRRLVQHNVEPACRKPEDEVKEGDGKGGYMTDEEEEQLSKDMVPLADLLNANAD